MRYERNDYRVRTRDGVHLRVRQVSGPGDGPRRVIVLVHGLAASLEPTYDLSVPGYSILEELASRGYRAVAFDHRNFGGSDRVPALDRPPQPDPEHRGLHTLDDSVEDIRAVVADCLARYQVPDVVLFGSSRGALQVLAYAAGPREGVSLVIMNNPSTLCYLASAREEEALREVAASRAAAAREHTYLECTAAYLTGRWAKLFGDRNRVEPAVQEAYIEACLRTDPEGARRDPPMFRVPIESIPERVPLLALEDLGTPCLALEGEDASEEEMAAFVRSAPAGLLRVMRIRETDHFTLRNARRFELVNIVDAAASALGWGRATLR